MPIHLDFEETLNAISFDWIQLNNASHQDMIAAFVQATTYCLEKNKEELVLRDIAPNSQIDHDNPSKIVEVHDRLTRMFGEAFTSLDRDIPEVRLNLNRGQFDLRFYMGKDIPRDYSYDDDR